MKKLKVKFIVNDATYQYEVNSISWHLDDEGLPIDIGIFADNIEVLEDIADNLGSLGFNVKEVDYPEHRFEALYGRLLATSIIVEDYTTSFIGYNWDNRMY